MFTGSKRELLEIIKRQGSVTMDIITTLSDLSKTTLREHLLQLERDGYIRRTFLRTGPGRPKLSYKLTSLGHRLFPSLEGELLRGLLNFLKENGNEEKIEKFFESYWEERYEKAREILRNIPRAGIKEKISALAEMLEEQGFMPEFEIKDSFKNTDDVFNKTAGVKDKSVKNIAESCQTIQIRECNCPFSQAVRETRLPCKLEALFFERLFNQKMIRTTYIADGEHACTYEFEVPH